METLYERLGGEPVLRRVIDAFVDRLFSDRMIGFFFRSADRERIKAMEFQWTARLLGAEVAYQGKALEEAHAKHRIMGGQFMRRQQILKETLDELGVPMEIQRAWLEHNEKLRPLITRDKGSDCDPSPARQKAEKRRP